LAEFDKRGLRVVAISVDSPEVSRQLCAKQKYTFTILADTDRTVVTHYDLLHRGAGPHHSDIARPAEFLVDNGGTIRWRNLTESIAVRLRPEQVLSAFDSLTH
jgi:peroxiredoxin